MFNTVLEFTQTVEQTVNSLKLLEPFTVTVLVFKGGEFDFCSRFCSKEKTFSSWKHLIKMKGYIVASVTNKSI